MAKHIKIYYEVDITKNTKEDTVQNKRIVKITVVDDAENPLKNKYRE